jgi:diguanylate cyclase (GGDEF)-like protein
LTDNRDAAVLRQDPRERELELRHATIWIGFWLTLIVAAGAEVYALATWSHPHRALITAVFVAAVASAVVVRALPTRRIVASSGREPFFLAWSVTVIVLIAIVSAADGGVGSPFSRLFVLPLLFGSLSYPLPSAIAVGVIDATAFLLVALTQGGATPEYISFAAFALVCAALLTSWEARNQGRRRRSLGRATEALQSSEETSRLQARQQREVAAFGQRALRGEDIETLLNEALSIAERALSVDIAAVLKLIPREQAFVLRAAVGLPEDVVNTQKVPAGVSSQAGYTLVTGSPVIVREWANETRFGQSKVLADAGVVSGLTVPIRAKGEPYGVLGVQTREQRDFSAEDVSFMQAISNVLANAIDRRAAEDRTRWEALHDPLTGLANRNLFLDRLGHALAQAQRRSMALAVLFLDLDQFKLVNDSLGHAAGDELLAAVAPRLADALRPGDTVARFGGDEFAVLAEDVTTPDDATLIAERIGAAFAMPFTLRSREHYVSASIGISIGIGGEAPEALIRDADAALYRAKEHGRGGYEVFDTVMRSRVVEHMQTENDLRRALERREFELHYQPVVSLRDGEIVTLEALIRWRHPTRGLIGPAAFIPVAEESRLIGAIGRWVVEEACRSAASWQAMDPDGRPVGVALNLSGRQLADPDLPRIVARAIEASGIDPATVDIELTESVLLERADVPEQSLMALKALGARLVLDDFGIGFSSLGYLKRFPLDAIKLDRSFIENLAPGSADTAIVRAVVEMAAALGLGVVAEGVETADQMRAVRDLGCEYAQGFHFTRPVSAAEVGPLLERPPWRQPLPEVGLAGGS